MVKVGKEREIRFDRSLRYQRQAEYDIFDYELLPWRFETGEKKAYKNLNLSIFVDDECNADCRFCVAQLRYEHRKQLYRKEHISDDAQYLSRLREVLEAVRPLNPSVSITGGEPTISPRLLPIIRMVDELGFRKRTITTNGSGLLNASEGKTIVEHLIENGFDHLNISRVCPAEDKNKGIMRYAPGTPYCSNEHIKQIAEITSGGNMRIRMSCILLRSSVKNTADIKEYVDHYRQYGIDNFIFRQLMDYDHKAVNLEKIAYCDENKVDLNTVWEEMEKDPEITPYMNLLGYYYYVELYDYHGCRVAGESADLEQQYREKKKHPDVIYEMVFHTDGVLAGSWIPSEEILMDRPKF